MNVDKVRCKELRHTEVQRGEHIHAAIGQSDVIQDLLY